MQKNPQKHGGGGNLGDTNMKIMTREVFWFSNKGKAKQTSSLWKNKITQEEIGFYWA